MNMHVTMKGLSKSWLKQKRNYAIIQKEMKLIRKQLALVLEKQVADISTGASKVILIMTQTWMVNHYLEHDFSVYFLH